MTCTFFGHRDTPQNIQEILLKTIIELIEKQNVDLFYVGNQGGFDYMVRNTLRNLKKDYPHIRYFVVLAYMPRKKSLYDMEDFTETIYPEAIAKTPPKFAINRRNIWMIEKSDYVVTYVLCNTGGASKFKNMAIKKGKKVINLAK